MATLILSTVGTLVGGPIGGALGAIIGQQIDSRVFAPKGRKGPRLNELAVQSSTYGSAIPKLFGANRVAGTVIWATDLKESKRKVSNGKGQPKSTVYSYSASFAVALSARPIARIGQIWADGNLLRGASGDFKSETRFRLHTGSEGQAVDPLIASAEGIGMTPAYRGLAYAVFEDFQLGDYGNRIPSLSFEIFADDGSVSVGSVLSALAGPGAAGDDPTILQGFAATGDSVRGVAETLAGLFPFAVRDDGGLLRLEAVSEHYDGLRPNDLGASHEGKAVPRLARERRSEASLPAILSVAHYEPERDYQQGLQRVRDGGGGRRDVRIDMPVTLDAARIKGHAAAALHRMRIERTTAKIQLPWRYLDLVPGLCIAVPGDAGEWRVSAVTLNRMVVEAELVRHAIVPATGISSDPGRTLAQADEPHGPTIFHILDLPPLEDAAQMAPQVAVAAAGIMPGWRRAALLVSLDDGLSWHEAGPTAAPAVMGVTQNNLGPASALIWDEANRLDVALPNAGMALRSATPEAVLAGANAALVGDELVQFRTATPLGENVYRLSGLLRGRRGTESAISGHAAGEPFVLVEQESLALLDVPPGTGQVRVIAAGVADPQSSGQGLLRPGRGLLPLAPVHLRADLLDNGDTEIRWVRRSRAGWRWLDGVDAPLAEETERYRIAMTPDGLQRRIFEHPETRFTYSASERAADRASGATAVVVEICQMGSFGLSRPATITLFLT